MIDPRFFHTSEPLLVSQVINELGRRVLAEGSQSEITRVADLTDENLDSAVVFVSDPKFIAEGLKSLPSVCIVSKKVAEKTNLTSVLPEVTILESNNPRADFATLADLLHKSIAEEVSYGNTQKSAISETAKVHPSAVIGESAIIEDDVTVCANSVIGPGVHIGAGSTIGPNVSITHALLGKHTKISGGARIGEAGFGFVQVDGKQRRIPQLGRVIVEDEVEIGANTTIDRGALNDTIIGAQTKIDNLVQIGHNCRIGRRCAIASQTGISGSTILGDDVMVGGQVGLADHLTIGDNAVIVARAGLMKDIPAGEKWGGYPAKPARQWFKEVAAVTKLATPGKG